MRPNGLAKMVTSETWGIARMPRVDPREGRIRLLCEKGTHSERSDKEVSRKKAEQQQPLQSRMQKLEEKLNNFAYDSMKEHARRN